jgi:hypothetical protein
VTYYVWDVEHSARKSHATGLEAANGVQHFFLALFLEDLVLTGEVKSAIVLFFVAPSGYSSYVWSSYPSGLFQYGKSEGIHV